MIINSLISILISSLIYNYAYKSFWIGPSISLLGFLVGYVIEWQYGVDPNTIGPTFMELGTDIASQVSGDDESSGVIAYENF